MMVVHRSIEKQEIDRPLRPPLGLEPKVKRESFPRTDVIIASPF
jgi:hypothetical protein